MKPHQPIFLYKKISWFIFILLGLMSLASCAQNAAYPEDKKREALRIKANPEMALVYLYRVKNFVNGGVNMEITLDGEFIGKVQEGFFHLELQPGWHEFQATFGPFVRKQRIQLERGKIYFLRLETEADYTDFNSHMRFNFERIGNRNFALNELQELPMLQVGGTEPNDNMMQNTFANSKEDRAAKNFKANEQKATLYIYRGKETFPNIEVAINQSYLGRLYLGYFVVQMEPGEYSLEASRGWMIDELKINMQKGEVYFIEVSTYLFFLNGHWLHWNVIDRQDVAKKEIQNLELLEIGGEPDHLEDYKQSPQFAMPRFLLSSDKDKTLN